VGFLDRLLGREPRTQSYTGPVAPRDAPAPPRAGGQGEDERAIARYRYLLRTAPPDQIERVHREAFARLSPEQREQVLGELSRGLPEGERLGSTDPATMARAATRAEMRQPGFMERTLGGAQRGGVGMGGVFAGSMLGSIAGVVVGSAIAQSLLGGYPDSPEAEGDPTAADTGEGLGAEGAQEADQGSGEVAAGDTAAADYGGSDYGGSDYGGSDYGGGFGGGGDFGGGDFGGDFGGGF
jgi:hypothetical protein